MKLTSDMFDKKNFKELNINDGEQRGTQTGIDYTHSLEARAQRVGITIDKLKHLIQKGIDNISLMHSLNPKRFPDSCGIVINCSVSKVKLFFKVNFKEMFCRFNTVVDITGYNSKDDIVLNLSESKQLFGENYKDFTLHVFNNENNEPQFKIDNDKIIELEISQ